MGIMKKTIRHFALFPLLFAPLCACSSSPADASQTSKLKDEEVVRTVDKAKFEQIVTNRGLIDLTANVTLDFVVSGRKSRVKINYYLVEFDEAYTGTEPTPIKYYRIDQDRADLTLVDPYSGKVLRYLTTTHDDAVADLQNAVTIVGPSFVYDGFAYQESTGAYYAQSVQLPTGYSMTDVNFFFENDVLVKFTAKEQADDGQMDISVTIHDYGATKVTMP